MLGGKTNAQQKNLFSLAGLITFIKNKEIHILNHVMSKSKLLKSKCLVVWMMIFLFENGVQIIISKQVFLQSTDALHIFLLLTPYLIILIYIFYKNN